VHEPTRPVDPHVANDCGRAGIVSDARTHLATVIAFDLLRSGSTRGEGLRDQATYLVPDALGTRSGVGAELELARLVQQRESTDVALWTGLQPDLHSSQGGDPQRTKVEPLDPVHGDVSHVVGAEAAVRGSGLVVGTAKVKIQIKIQIGLIRALSAPRVTTRTERIASSPVPAIAREDHSLLLLCRHGRVLCRHGWAAPLAREGRVPTGGTMPSSAAGSVGQLLDTFKVCPLHPLNDKLRDSITTGDGGRLMRIVIDQVDLDFTPVAGIDRTWSVQHGNAEAVGQTGARVDEPDVAQRQCDRDSGRDQSTRAGRQGDVDGCAEVGTGVAVMRVRRHRHLGIEPPYRDPDRAVPHRSTTFCEVHPLPTSHHHRAASIAPMPVPTDAGLRTSPYSPGVAPRPELPRSDAGSPSVSTLFDERLIVSWWAWPVAAAIAAFLAAELAIGAYFLRHWSTFVLAALVAIAGLVWLSRIRVQVQAAAPQRPTGEQATGEQATGEQATGEQATGERATGQGAAGAHPAEGVLRVDDAALPVHAIAAVVPLDADRRRELLGTGADPLGFVIQRPWIPGGVRIDLDDPTDPTPYWFVSTRRPQALAAALYAVGVPRPPAG
jgi:hypothetical protein